MILRTIIQLSALGFVLLSCEAQVLQFGTCAEVETVTYFDIEKFLGKWYEIERFPTWYEEFGACAYKTIEICGRRVEIGHGYVKEGIQYVLHVNSSYAPGDNAVFEIKENSVDPIGIPLTVPFTDYENYAIIYGCKNSELLGIKYISAWILSRNTTLPTEIQQKAYWELNTLPYASIAYLQTVPQDNDLCDYYWTAHIQAEENTQL